MIQFVNKKYNTNWYLEKKFTKKEKKLQNSLKKKKITTFVRLINDLPELPCQAEKKNNTNTII